MAKQEIIGFDVSNWVRAARIACEEKGVGYELTTNGMTGLGDLKLDKHFKLHPFGRIPAMRHGDVVLFETAAICRYGDGKFNGPPLVPEDALEAARMEQWVCALMDYATRSVMGRCVNQYVIPQLTGSGKVDRATIDAAIPDIRTHLAILNRALSKGPFLHGKDPHIDDFILMPIIAALVAVAPGRTRACGPGAERCAPPQGIPGAAELRGHHSANVPQGGLIPQNPFHQRPGGSPPGLSISWRAPAAGAAPLHEREILGLEMPRCCVRGLLLRIAQEQLGPRLEAEAAGLATALHAFLMLHLAAHEAADETDVEPADLGIFLGQIVIDAVLALNPGQGIAFFRCNGARDEAGLIHNLYDLRDALQAGPSHQPWNCRRGHLDTKVEHVLREIVGADLRA